MEKAKAIFHANIILENSEDSRKLCKSIKNIFHNFSASSLSENLSLKTICEKFSNFFVDKITIIRSQFPDDNELRKFYTKDIGESCRISPTFPHGMKFNI